MLVNKSTTSPFRRPQGLTRWCAPLTLYESEKPMTNFTARKIRNRYIQHFVAAPDKVFPLLCPVREYEWIEPWQCEILHSDSGVAEKNCVFRTSDDVWVISHYEPNTRIEFIRVNPNRTMCLAITLTDNGDGTTRATNDQLLVGLTAEGNQSLEEMATGFSFEMRMGEAMLNHYLTTGTLLPMKQAAEIASRPK